MILSKRFLNQSFLIDEMRRLLWKQDLKSVPCVGKSTQDCEALDLHQWMGMWGGGRPTPPKALPPTPPQITSPHPPPRTTPPKYQPTHIRYNLTTPSPTQITPLLTLTLPFQSKQFNSGLFFKNRNSLIMASNLRGKGDSFVGARLDVVAHQFTFERPGLSPTQSSKILPWIGKIS